MTASADNSMKGGGKKHIVFVLGVHRSGTSAVARWLNVLGANLGESLLKAQEGINDRGFWENETVVSINERILSLLGSSWYDFRSYPDDWWCDPLFDPVMDEIKTLLSGEFSGSQLVAIKDPRLCRLLPLWVRAAVASGWTVNAVAVYRNPFLTCQSIAHRDGFPLAIVKMLWATSALELELYSRNMETFYVNYDELLAHPVALSRKLVRCFPGREFHLDDSVEAELPEVLDERLRHFKVDRPGLVEAEDEFDYLMQEIIENFREPRTREVRARMDRLRKDFFDYIHRSPSLADSLVASLRRFVETNQHLSRLGKMHDHAVSVVQERDAQLTELSRGLRATEASLAESVKAEKERQEMLDKSREALRRCEKALQEALKEKLTLERANSDAPRKPLRGAAENAKIASLTKQRDDLRVTLEKRQDEARHSANRIQELEGTLTHLQKQLAHYAESLASKQKLVETLLTEQEKREVEYAALQQELESTVLRIQEAEASRKHYLEARAVLERARRQLVEDNKALTAKWRHLQKFTAQQKEELDALRSVNKDKNIQLDYFEQQFLQLNKERIENQRILGEREAYLNELESAHRQQGRYLDEALHVVLERDRQLSHLNDKYMRLRTRLWVKVMFKLGVYK